MVVNYVTNAPTSVNWLWAIAKNFLEDHTVKKIKINKNVASQEMFSHINPSQLEAKYGGRAPNVQTFWPPTIPEGPFATPHENPESYLSQVSSYAEYFPPLPYEESDVEAQVSEVIEEALEVVEELLEVEEEIISKKKRSRQRAEPDNTALPRPKYIQDKEFAAAFAHLLISEQVIEEPNPPVQETKRRHRPSITFGVESLPVEVISEKQQVKVLDVETGHTSWSLCWSCRCTSVTCSLV
jgi:hypothetical protein